MLQFTDVANFSKQNNCNIMNGLQCKRQQIRSLPLFLLLFNFLRRFDTDGWVRGWVSQLEFNVPFQHKYGYIRDERSGMESYPYPV